MKLIIGIGIAIGLAAGRPVSARAEPEPSPAPAPAISFEETVHDAGESWEGEVVAHTFRFTNTGNAELKISRVRSTCGCTASNLSSDTIAPGESGEIRASFNTRDYRGKKSQPVYVTSNDPSQPTVQLRLETTIKTVAAFSPASLQFGQVVYGQGATRETSLVFDGESFPVREVTATPEYFLARILETEGETGENGPVRIEVTLSPETPVGRHRGNLTARIDHPQSPELSGRLMASVEGIIVYSPRMLFFNQRDQEQKAVKIISLTNNGDRPVAIGKVTAGSPEFQAELKTIKPGKEFEIEVRFRPETEPGRYSTDLTIETDLAEQGRITVPLRANIGP